jgi:hypothetical protein
VGSSCFYVTGAIPGVPAGFLFLLLVTPLSKEVVKGSEEGDGAVEVVVLSSMDEDFVWDLVAIWCCR